MLNAAVLACVFLLIGQGIALPQGASLPCIVLPPPPGPAIVVSNNSALVFERKSSNTHQATPTGTPVSGLELSEAAGTSQPARIALFYANTMSFLP